MLFKTCLLLVVLAAISAEPEDEIFQTVKAGETISIEVIDRAAAGGLCTFEEPLKRRKLVPTTDPKTTDDADVDLVDELERTDGWTFELAGGGNLACGIQIKQVDKNDHGSWAYDSGNNGNINLTVEGTLHTSTIYSRKFHINVFFLQHTVYK